MSDASRIMEPLRLRAGERPGSVQFVRQQTRDSQSFAGGPPDSGAFTALLGEYRNACGVVRGEDLAGMMANRRRGDYVSLARCVAARDVFCFQWRGVIWVPMFQFDARDLSIRSESWQVFRELDRALTGWAVATWFAQRNARLLGKRPVDVLANDLPAALDAARSHRLSATG